VGPRGLPLLPRPALLLHGLLYRHVPQDALQSRLWALRPAVPVQVGSITETNRLQFVILCMQDRTPGPYLVTIRGILVPVMWGCARASPCLCSPGLLPKSGLWNNLCRCVPHSQSFACRSRPVCLSVCLSVGWSACATSDRRVAQPGLGAIRTREDGHRRAWRCGALGGAGRSGRARRSARRRRRRAAGSLPGAGGHRPIGSKYPVVHLKQGPNILLFISNCTAFIHPGSSQTIADSGIDFVPPTRVPKPVFMPNLPKSQSGLTP
jgi:hypothetical protein